MEMKKLLSFAGWFARCISQSLSSVSLGHSRFNHFTRFTKRGVPVKREIVKRLCPAPVVREKRVRGV
jgi:hypothetical protein